MLFTVTVHVIPIGLDLVVKMVSRAILTILNTSAAKKQSM